MFPTLEKKFDEKALLQTEGSSRLLQQSKVTNVAKSLRSSGTAFLPKAEGYRVIGKTVENFAGSMEICDCHQSFWQPQRSFKKRQKIMKDSIGSCTCIWQGRRLPWFIAVGFRQFLADLDSCTSPRLQRLLGEMESEPRARLLLTLGTMRQQLADIYKDKFQYLFHLTHHAIGAYYSVQGGSDAEARIILQAVLDEVDTIVRAGKILTLDRIAKKLWIQGALVRVAAEAYIQDQSLGLKDCPRLFVALQEYALCNGVARRIEKLHATVKRLGSHSYGIGIPCICSKLRESQSLAKVRENNDFRMFCVSEWNSRSITKKLLQVRFDTATLKNKSLKEMIDLIYQCSAEHAYTDLREIKAVVKSFEVKTNALKDNPVKVSEDEQLCIQYLKDSVFTRGAYYTFPRQLYESAAVFKYVVVDGATNDCVNRCVNACLRADLEATLENMICFRVTDTKPENRKTLQVSHVAKDRTHIQVRRCSTLNLDARTMCVAEWGPVTTSDKLDLLAMVANIEQVVSECFRWRAVAAQSRPILRPLRALTTGPTAGMASVICAVAGAQPIQDMPPADAPPPADALALCLANSSAASVVEQMAAQGQFSGSGRAFVDMGLHEAEVLALRDAGVLKSVDPDQDVFGENRMVVRAEAFDWKAAVCVKTALPVNRACQRHQNRLKMSKLQLMIELRQEGWRPDSSCETQVSLAVGAFRPGMKQPLSYFAAIHDRARIFDKGLASFAHGMPDFFYRCLLNCPADKLLVILANLEDKNDAWFRDQHKKNRVDSDSFVW